MFELTRATRFIPGSNVKGQVTGANWLYLLPRLSFERILCIGQPPDSTLAMLVTVATEVIVADRPHAAVAAGANNALAANVKRAAFDPPGPLPLPSNSTDLVAILSRRYLRRLGGDPQPLLELERVLRPGGLIYCEFDPLLGWLFAHRAIHSLQQVCGGGQRFQLWPGQGELQAAVPWKRRRQLALQHGADPSPQPLWLRPLRRLAKLPRQLAQSVPRQAVVVAGEARDQPIGPPAYLTQLAEQAAVSLAHFHWELSAPGLYNSRKVLFHLYAPAATSPTYVVKLTRARALNVRLENEHRALRSLAAQGLEGGEQLPRAVFFGHHAGLAVLGESFVRGVPFWRKSRGRPDCPLARSAVDWLNRLAGATADDRAATPAEVAHGLSQLLNRFVELYQPSAEREAFLREQVAVIGQGPAALPLVFQHGDPGTWNLLATAAGQAVFLDWEAAEAKGLPLWDVLYFLRSYCVSAGRLRGLLNPLRAYERLFLAESDLTAFVAQSVEQAGRAAGVPQQYVPALVYTCWMHRALKEATRLPPQGLLRGHYVNLLWSTIAQRRSPVLRRLFGA